MKEKERVEIRCAWCRQPVLVAEARIERLEAELATAKAAMRGAIPIVAPVLKLLGFHHDDACAARWNDASGKEIIALRAELAKLRGKKQEGE